MRILLGVSAGIAAYKVVQVARGLREAGHDLQVIPTPASLEFIGAATWEAISGQPVSTSVFDNVDTVNHVRFGQEADLVIVAPATADIIARMRTGQADDLLSTSLLATRAPVLVAPAMHTEMWQHPATQDNVQQLRARGVTVMEPGIGRLTGSDTGPGRLPEPEQILAQAEALLGSQVVNPGQDAAAAPGQATQPAAQTPQPGPPLDTAAEPDLAGYHLVITAGGTREPLDPVRFLGNRSSGKQGFALAATAVQRGAQVCLILGPSDPLPPELAAAEQAAQLRLIRIETTQQLLEKVTEAVSTADALVMAAAVADYRPAKYSAAKLKKTPQTEQGMQVELVRNPDVLAQTVRRRRATGSGPHCIVGFAAETAPGGAGADDTGADPRQAVRALAETKLLTKGCELLVLNQVSEEKVFGRDDTEIEIFASLGVQGLIGESGARTLRGTKTEAAQLIWDQVLLVLTAYQRL